MKQQYNSDGTVTVWVNGAELLAMEDNELGIYHTPGSSQVYIASGPQFRDDLCVVTTGDLLYAMGYDSSDGLCADDIAELIVEV